MPTVLTFGDSNTHGTPPIHIAGTYARFGAGVRWPTRLAGWDVIEEGLPMRTTRYADPEAGVIMAGTLGLPMALRSHGPIDVLTIMLGTNDCKTCHGAEATDITDGLAALLDIALLDDLQARHGGYKVLVICPPAIIETGVFADEFAGAADKSRALGALYQTLATERGVGFLDLGPLVDNSPIDGIHFSADTHAEIAGHVTAALADL